METSKSFKRKLVSFFAEKELKNIFEYEYNQKLMIYYIMI